VEDRAVRAEQSFGFFQKQRWPTPWVGPGFGRPWRWAGAKLHWGSVAGPTPETSSDPAT